MKTRTWNNIPGSIFIECGICDCGDLIDCHKDISLPQSLKKELEQLFGKLDSQSYCEIEIPFLSSGFSDSGRTYGNPYYCYPPEYNDERLLDECCIIIYYYLERQEDGWKKLEFNLSKKVSEELFEFYLDDIMDKELDFDEYDDSDYKYERMLEQKYGY